MAKEMLQRKFQFWNFNVSHGMLLVRSPKKDDDSQNIDILFFNVSYVELPRFLYGIKIEKCRKDEVDYINQKLKKEVKAKEIHVIISNGCRYFVVASIIKIIKNDLDLFELPYDHV